MNPSIEDLLNGVRAANARARDPAPQQRQRHPHRRAGRIRSRRTARCGSCRRAICRRASARCSPSIRARPSTRTASACSRPSRRCVRSRSRTRCATPTSTGTTSRSGTSSRSSTTRSPRWATTISVSSRQCSRREAGMPELVTVYRGDDVTEADAEALVGTLREGAHGHRVRDPHRGSGALSVRALPRVT